MSSVSSTSLAPVLSSLPSLVASQIDRDCSSAFHSFSNWFNLLPISSKHDHEFALSVLHGFFQRCYYPHLQQLALRPDIERELMDHLHRSVCPRIHQKLLSFFSASHYPLDTRLSVICHRLVHQPPSFWLRPTPVDDPQASSTSSSNEVISSNDDVEVPDAEQKPSSSRNDGLGKHMTFDINSNDALDGIVDELCRIFQCSQPLECLDCVKRTCVQIFQLNREPMSSDEFIPLLIYVVVQAAGRGDVANVKPFASLLQMLTGVLTGAGLSLFRGGEEEYLFVSLCNAVDYLLSDDADRALRPFFISATPTDNDDNSDEDEENDGLTTSTSTMNNETEAFYSVVFLNAEVDIGRVLDTIKATAESSGLQLSDRFLAIEPILRQVAVEEKLEGTGDERIDGGIPVLDPAHFELFVNLPYELRDQNIFTHVARILPIFGLRESGVTLSDCPGLRENAALSYHSQKSAQHADIIIYAMPYKYQVPNDTLRFLREQMHLGASVLFVMNRRASYVPADFDNVLGSLQNQLRVEFPHSPTPLHIHAVDFHRAHDCTDERAQAEFLEFQGVLCRTLQDRAKGMVFHFSRAFIQLLRAQYVTLSHFVSAAVTPFRQKKNNQSSASAFQEQLQQVLGQINELMASADKRIESYWSNAETGLRQRYLKLVARKIQSYASEVEEMPVQEAFVPPTASSWKTFLRIGYTSQMTPFESEIMRTLVNDFHRCFESAFSDWAANIRKDFADYLAVQASKIQEVTASWSAKHNSVIAPTQAHLFTRAESQIESFGRKNIPVITLSLGVGGMSGIICASSALVIGLLSTTVALTGIIALGVLGITGIIGTAVLYKKQTNKDQRSEAQVRQGVVETLAEFLNDAATKPDFETFLRSPLDYCKQIRNYTRSTLLINVFEAASSSEHFVHSLDALSSIDYNSLCRFVYLRDELATAVTSLTQLLSSFDERDTPNFSQLLSHRNQLTKAGSCTLCLRDYHNCRHLCPSCHYALSGSCPTCSRGEVLAQRNSEKVAHLIEQHFTP